MTGAIAEQCFGPPGRAVDFELDRSGHPKPDALQGFVTSTIDRAVTHVHDNFGLISDPTRADEARRHAHTLAQKLQNERSKDLRFGWHEDVDQVNSISRELAGIAIDAYVGTLGESGAEPP